jgi:cell division septation protein DedD
MPSNHDGEFELILGNKQLLSVFFIVVVLLGVFFAMGYIVGRNSTPLRADTGSAAKSTESTGGEKAKLPAIDSGTDSTRAEAPPAVADERAQRQPAEPETVPVQTHPAEPPKSASTAQDEKTAGADAPPTGIYWQVAATKQAEADMLVDLLKGKGFKARTAPAPGTDGYFRVIVGPAPTTAALSSLKASLEAAGYKQPIKRDY